MSFSRIINNVEGDLFSDLDEDAITFHGGGDHGIFRN